MISDAKIELQVEKAEDLIESAVEFVPSQPGLAAEQMRQAALIYFEVASDVEETEVKKRYMKKGLQVKRRADSLPTTGDVEDTPLTVETSDSGTGDDNDEGQRSDPDRKETSDSEFFDEPPEKDLGDVGGLQELKSELRENVEKPLEHPEFYRQQGAGIQNGILFYGPPGTGKSHLAECFAGELGYEYASVSAAQIASKWVGEAPKNIQKLFSEAKHHEPCVIFLDEIDALAAERGGNQSETRSERQTVNELLQQMQGIQESDILVIAATNKDKDLDEAITRSQRFNQKFHVGLPDPKARLQILRVQLDEDGRKVDWESIDWKRLVKWSQGFSAADLADVIDDAVRKSADESTNRGKLVPVNQDHLMQAVKSKEPSEKKP